jgi:hypothetical protein
MEAATGADAIAIVVRGRQHLTNDVSVAYALIAEAVTSGTDGRGDAHDYYQSAEQERC